MLLELVIFFALASATCTLAAMLPGAVRARLFAGIPLAIIALGVAAAITAWITQDTLAALILIVFAVGAMLEVRIQFPEWSMLAALLLALLVLGSVSYLIYAGVQTVADGLGVLGTIGSFVLLLLEIVALSLSVYYLFEILDVLSRRHHPPHQADRSHTPKVAIQVPCYNEPVEVMEETLTALARLDYPDYLVQVVDNNTKDPAVWKPLEALCQKLGPRFHFLHLEPWPGFKAGALNEASRRLPQDIEIIGIVDADYVVQPNFLLGTVGHFVDPKVAFVQTPQHYRDWTDSGYLRALFYSYRYFFDITMPARAHRNAIIFAGTMGLIRRSALQEIGGWNERCITEDAEASLRLLGHGYTGVYANGIFGEGLMPLDFNGLKKQRFRWALGGIQILRQQWRELIPFARHRLRLTAGQRLHYLFGSAHWFSDVLTMLFTLLLLLTAVAAAQHHRLPIRELAGPVLVVPLAFLVSGVVRALWALRTAEHATWGDALRALGIWFGLAWVDTLAVLRGLTSRKAAFLRTAKRKEGGSRLWPALRASALESSIAGLALIAAIVMFFSEPSFATGILAVMLLIEGWIFGNAFWASLAAEGIHLTPQRRAYLRSAQVTGERPSGFAQLAALPVGVALVAAVVLALTVLTARPAASPGQADLPQIGTFTHQKQKLPKTGPPPALPAPSASSLPSATPSTAASPTPSG
jgi:glycosyltransferase involved in cell wall biosynthesis